MKKFLNRFLIYFGFLTLLFPLVSLTLEKTKPNGFFVKLRDVRGETGFTWTRLREAENTWDVDVLILGSSLAYRGIDTRAFDSLDIKVFNLGTSAQTPLETEYLVDKFIERLNPKLVIWELSPNGIMDSGLESFIDLCSNEGVNYRIINLFYQLGRFDAISTLVTIGLKRILSIEDEFMEPLVKGKDKYISGGFVERVGENSESFENLDEIEFAPKFNQIKAVNRVLERIKNENIKLILVNAPIHPERRSTFRNLAQFDAINENLVIRHDLIASWNFNKFNFSSEEFYDNYHLNQNGVIKFNSLLLMKLNPYLQF